MNKDTIEFLWSLLKGKFYTYRFSKCGKRLAIHGKLRTYFSNAIVEVVDHVKIWPNVKLSVNGTAENQLDWLWEKAYHWVIELRFMLEKKLR